MAKTKQQKEEITNKLSEILKGAKSLVFAGFDKLSVSDATELRSNLRKDGTGYMVAKKSLLARALESDGPKEGEQPELAGQIAIAWGDDLVMPAKGVADFAKGRDEQIAIVGGIFEGRYMSAPEMREIASIPGEQTLRGMFVNVINSPIQGLVIALNGIAEKKS